MIHLATEREKRKRSESGRLRRPRIVELLAQAEEFQRLLDSGEAASRADLARRFRLSRARVTQIMNLLKLHPAIRNSIRKRPRPVHRAGVTEGKLRALIRLEADQQLEAARHVLVDIDPTTPRRRSA